ncbi:hypothetical protein [Undibacterium sp. TC9W]|uniref:hypothetical protein n=1 Tax=Undibacterium sp. TC9W TaxID=3413053 RepID=UPI003BEFB809
MTGVILGRPNAEPLTVAQFKALTGALIREGYVLLEQLEPKTDSVLKCDLIGDSRTNEEEMLAEQKHEIKFQNRAFKTLDEVASHYATYPELTVTLEMNLYDWSKIEGDYGYKLALEPSHPARVLQELVIDAANEGNRLIGWENPPMAEVMYLCLCQYGLFIDVQRCPPDMAKTISAQPRYAQIQTLLTSVLEAEPEIYTMHVA